MGKRKNKFTLTEISIILVILIIIIVIGFISISNIIKNHSDSRTLNNISEKRYL